MAKTETPTRPRARVRYLENVVPAMQKEFGFENVMRVPALKKIVINVGLGEAIADAKALDSTVEDVSLIAGQRPVVTKAKKSIAAFKVRAGMSIGVMVTLRGNRMYEFYDRLISTALPRIRDFRGVSSKAFDGRGNYSLGITEQIVFPEIDYDKVDRIRGLQVSIVTTARNDVEGRRLLELMGMPYAR